MSVFLAHRRGLGEGPGRGGQSSWERAKVSVSPRAPPIHTSWHAAAIFSRPSTTVANTLPGTHPERFRALIIGNTFAWPVNGDPRFERFSRLMGGPAGWFLIRYCNAFVNLLIPFGVGRQKVPRQVMEHYRQPFRGSPQRRVPTYIFPRAILHSRAYLEGVAAALPQLADKAVLIVWGTDDPAFGAKERERFEGLFPHHRTVILEGAGHFIQEDAPTEIVQAIRNWMPEGGGGGPS